jgi:protein-tyrosine-phosphatase
MVEATHAGSQVRSVAVVGTRTASRSVAMATLIRDCIERHGWSERLHVEVGGLGSGAGTADASDIGMLARDGYAPIAQACTDVRRNRGLLDGADCFVVASAEDAYVLLEWPEAEGKHVLALVDYLDEKAWAIADPESGFRDFMDEINDAIPFLVRALIAWPPP